MHSCARATVQVLCVRPIAGSARARAVHAAALLMLAAIQTRAIERPYSQPATKVSTRP